MCVCVYARVHACEHVCLFVCAHVHLCVYMCVDFCFYIHRRVCMCLHVGVCACVYIYQSACGWVCMRAGMYMYLSACECVCTRVYFHTATCKWGSTFQGLVPSSLVLRQGLSPFWRYVVWRNFQLTLLSLPFFLVGALGFSHALLHLTLVFLTWVWGSKSGHQDCIASAFIYWAMSPCPAQRFVSVCLPVLPATYLSIQRQTRHGFGKNYKSVQRNIKHLFNLKRSDVLLPQSFVEAEVPWPEIKKEMAERRNSLRELSANLSSMALWNWAIIQPKNSSSHWRREANTNTESWTRWSTDETGVGLCRIKRLGGRGAWKTSVSDAVDLEQGLGTWILNECFRHFWH